jgi:hypothetical protein
VICLTIMIEQSTYKRRRAVVRPGLLDIHLVTSTHDS